jgi:hypothetical protein
VTQNDPKRGSTRRDERQKRAQREQAPRFEVRKLRESNAEKAAAAAAAAGTTTGTRASIERREERERERRRRRIRNTIIIAVAIVGVVGALLLLRSAPADAPIPETTAARFADLPQLRGQDGLPRLGDPDARVQVTFYAAFDTRASKTLYEAVIVPLTADQVRAGEVSIVYVPLAGANELTNGLGATRAALCASEQNAFWTFTDMAYSWQALFTASQAYTQNRIVSGVNNLGLNRADFDGCVLTGRSDDIIARARQSVSGLLNFTAAPAIAINGVIPTDDEGVPLVEPAAILAAIDARIAEFAAAEAALEATPEATPDAEATPSAETTLEADATPDADATPSAETTPEADATPDADATPEATPAS